MGFLPTKTHSQKLSSKADESPTLEKSKDYAPSNGPRASQTLLGKENTYENVRSTFHMEPQARYCMHQPASPNPFQQGAQTATPNIKKDWKLNNTSITRLKNKCTEPHNYETGHHSRRFCIEGPKSRFKAFIVRTMNGLIR